MSQNNAHSPAAGSSWVAKLRRFLPSRFNERGSEIEGETEQQIALAPGGSVRRGKHCASSESTTLAEMCPNLQQAKFLQELVSYNEAHGITCDNSLIDVLLDVFDQLEPTLQTQAGGSEYRECLESAIHDHCALELEKVRILDVYDNTQQYAAIVAQV